MAEEFVWKGLYSSCHTHEKVTEDKKMLAALKVKTRVRRIKGDSWTLDVHYEDWCVAETAYWGLKEHARLCDTCRQALKEKGGG